MRKINNRGLTLIELLVAIAISSMVITLIYHITLTSQKAAHKDVLKTALNNEAVYITEHMNEALLNTDQVEAEDLDEENNQFSSFAAINISLEHEGSSGDFQETRSTIKIKIADGNLYIDGKVINSPDYMLSNSYFTSENGNLNCYFTIKQKSSDHSLKFFTVYSIQKGEG
ncbi:PilW family protein [Falsibacillus albus]|uniref:Prepilin-type N-terminal cleavage/methylation domain-containing protein n=1 Tax=Falsibacillus albus TaxID=2478915 RepID=A0A3L7KBJ8_9BACI|nr:type II secretion system protein [Falsibacillus albus]RLQ98042.1 prepilin-type N-terminal cleavage/methylation domain-containing protein [Falsibacillus albus]